MGYAGVYISEFPVMVWLRLDPSLHSQPLAILEGKAPLERIASLNGAAESWGLSHSMTKVQAEAVGPVQFRARLISEEKSAFEVVREVAQRFSPRVQVIAEPENYYANAQTLSASLLLDQAGMEKLFGTDKQYGQKLDKDLKAAGFSSNVALTSNASASQLLARYHSGVTCVQTDQIAARLAPLPVSLLRCEHAILKVLGKWGIRTLGELAALPETALISRIGQQAKQLQRLALGIEENFFVPETEAFTLHEHVMLDCPLELLDSLLFVLSPMIDRVMRRAMERAYALRRVTLTLILEKAAPYELEIRPALPTQNRELLLKLLNLAPQSRPPEAPLLALTLMAEPAKAQSAQRGLFQAQFPEPDKLDLLIARLRSIVGEENVGTAQLSNSHRDDELTMVPFQPAVLLIKDDATLLNRLALRRCRPPQPVQVALRGGIPSILVCQGNRLELVETKGPWQSSGYWWDERQWAAEEWDAIVTQPAQALRLRHEVRASAWTIAGVYD